MNILQICNKSPYPPKEGGSIAMFNIADGLIKAGHTVDVLTISTNKFSVNTDSIPDDYKKVTSFTAVFVDTSIKVLNAFINLFSSKSYHVKRFESIDMKRKIEEILKEKRFDVIQLETVYIGCYIPTIRKYSAAPIVLRSHNIEHLIWKRHALKVRNPIKKLYINYLAGKLKKFENNTFANVDGIASITDVDSEFIIRKGISTPIKTIPFGVNNTIDFYVDNKTNETTFFHLGSMDWMPNQEGIKWFLDFCMPLISKEFPEISIFLAGRNMPSWIDNYKYKNLINVGEVDNATEFMKSHEIMFVPLFSGSGVRIKIIEGMSLGKVVISTTVGAEGINCRDGENILIANTPEQFVEKIKFCLENKAQCQIIGKNASELVRNYHNIKITTNSLIDFYKSILK